MLVLELYFLIYRIPKMMTKLARERQRSALLWSLIGVGTWIGAELGVSFVVAFTYAIVVAVQYGEVDEVIPPGIRTLAYVLGLVAAVVSVTLVQRFLTARPKVEFEPPPPPPPKF